MYPEAPSSTTQFPRIARLWLFSGVGALAVAGVLAFVLGIARTPVLYTMPVFAQLFHTALVAHVDLSMLVWFLAVPCTLWSIEGAKGTPRILIPFLQEAALGSYALGAVVIALSPFGGGEALMSNYIPVIASPLFFLGLALVGCGVGLQLVYYFLHAPAWAHEGAAYAQSVGAFTMAVITLFALACFAWSVPLMPPVFTGRDYYDLLFWGGGHVLQFTHTQMLIIAWMALASLALPRFAPKKRWVMLALMVGVVAAMAAPFAYLLFPIHSAQYRNFFTQEMVGAAGIGPLLVGIWIVMALRGKQPGAVFNALAASMLLFTYGGFLGGMIRGQNVTIPAHYHGEIVAVTLAFMGLAYSWLPRMGYRDVTQTKLARWQPVVLGVGQALHITGLAWSGGYGVMRKTPGALEGFSGAKAAMGLIEGGLTLALVGGLLFVIAVWRATRQPKAA